MRGPEIWTPSSRGWSKVPSWEVAFGVSMGFIRKHKGSFWELKINYHALPWGRCMGLVSLGRSSDELSRLLEVLGPPSGCFIFGLVGFKRVIHPKPQTLNPKP